MKRGWIVALSIGSLALSRTYHGGFYHTFWFVYSIVSLVLYFAFSLLDLLEAKS